ncbi:MAG: hypothetical protein K9G36_08040 [Crocinitomicaceae bacterium]|nr:hypothetical protein [Crocinitomicaceae bacterium]
MRVPIRNIAYYSSFGVQLDGRSVQSDFYRGGFNRKERDDVLNGAGKFND